MKDSKLIEMMKSNDQELKILGLTCFIEDCLHNKRDFDLVVSTISQIIGYKKRHDLKKKAQEKYLLNIRNRREIKNKYKNKQHG